MYIGACMGQCSTCTATSTLHWYHCQPEILHTVSSKKQLKMMLSLLRTPRWQRGEMVKTGTSYIEIC